MSTGDDDLSSGINGRLRPRKSYVSSPQTTKTTRRLESKLSHEKPKRVSTQSKNPLTKSDDLSKKSDFSSVLEYLCPYCDKNFVSKQTASKHTRRIHFLTSKQGDKGVINCLYCNHSDPEPNNIFKHMIDSHPNQYFACLDCHTRFLSTSELAEHKLNVCERQKLHYKSKLPQKSNRASKKSRKLDRQVVIRDEERHGYKSIVISCELKPTHVTDAADIEDNITTNLILPSINQANNIIDKNAVILLDDLQWKKRIPQNFSFHNTDTDQILSRLGVVHRSPRTGESTRKDWFKVIDDATQKFERCFDTNFYSKVASNVQENLSKFLDGSFNFNPDPNHTIKPRKAKNSVPINTVEGFPILLSCEQYSRNIFDVYMPRAIAPKHKWKWDNLENDRSSFNADQIKRDSHVNNCIVTLVSSLDIWTQLCMRHKFEEKFKTTPFEKKTEKKKIISNELKEILESRQLPPSTAQVSRNCTALVKVPNNLDFPTSLGLTPSTSKYEIQPAVLSGEWVRPRCYVCCACGAQTRDPRTLSTHILTEHPNAQVQHYEIPGELLLNADILRHLYVPPSPVQNRTRPPRGFRECTKCNKSITIEDLHQHMLDCAGDMPTVRRKCRYRHFGVRKRRTRIQDSRIRKKIRKDIHRQNGRPRPKIRSEVGDAETIRKMIADLPAKRHRVTPTGSNLRPKKKINPQLDQLTFSKRHTEDNKNRRFNTDSSTNTTFQGDGEPNNLKESKIMKNKLTRRSTVIINKKTNKTHRNDVNIRYDSRIEAVSNQLSLSSDSIASSAGSKTQVLSLQNQPNRINVNSGPYNTREQANGSNNDGSNNRENQNPERNDNDGNFRDQGAPPQNIPLKHSIARLTADSDTHDKAVQFHHLFLVQQECNNVTQHDPSGQPVFFEDKAVTDKLDKPPLETKEKGEDLDTLNNHKNKLNKQRKGLNDCIAMLKNKLVEPSKSPEVSIQCKIDETPNPPPKRVITNRNDITVQCPDDNQAPETVITPRSRNILNKGNITEKNVKSASRIASTKQKSESVTTHKVSLSINMENKHHDNPASVGISGTSELRNCERNNYLPVFKKTGRPPKYNESEINANASESVQNIQKIDNFVRRSVTPKRQAIHINVTAKESNNILTVINKESSSLDRSVMQVLESSHKEAHNGHESINESINKNKLYISEEIPPAHCIVDAESISTAPLDLSGKLYVNEVIAHSSKQDISYNSSAHVYETLDLSNKGINKVFQKGDINELSNDEVVVDLRVKPAIPSTSTASFNYAEDISYNDMTATDLSVRHTEFMPTDLSVKGKGKTGHFITMTRKDLSVMRPTSNFTFSQNDIIGLNLSPNEFPTDLSRTCLEVLSSKQVIGQDANNTTSSLDICDYDNTNSPDFPYGQHINKNIITTGKNITSHPIPLQYNTNGNSYKIQSRQMTIPSEVHIEDERFSADEFNQSRKVQYNFVDVSTMSGSSTLLDKAPMNLCNPLIKVSNCDSLHNKTHIASQECVKTLDILNMPLNPNNTSNLKTILRPSVSITPNYINATELAKSVKQADKQNASDLSLQPSKSKRSQENLTKRNYELNERNSCPIDNDPETAKKIALLPKELVDILGNMPVDHRNQLLNVLPQYVSVSTSAAPIRHDAFNDPKLSSSHRHSQPCNETDNTEIPQYSGMSKSQHSIVDRYQVPHPYYQPQGETKKSEGEYGQFHGSIEDTNKSCLNDNKRRSIDLSMCGIIDLTDDNVDTISCSISPEKENKTESPVVKAFGFKTNNEKTASLRAVRIKAPSERAKSIILETELKKIIPEKKYIDSHSSDSGNNDISPVVQKFETSVTKATNVHAVSVVDAILSEQIDTPLTLNRSELLDGHNEPRKERTTTNFLSNVPLQSLQTDMATFNSKSVSKDSVNISDSESPLQNDSLERRDNSQEVEKILESFDEDDSEDDVSLAVIVKQKQRKLGVLETCSNNVNSTNKNKSITNYSKEVMDSLDITPELKEYRAGAIFDKTDKNNYEEKGLDISITSKHKETSCKISAIMEGRSKSEKYFSPIKILKYSPINFDKTLPSNNESNVPLNEKYSEAVQTSLGDQDPHRLSSNNNTIANEIEPASQSACLLKPSTFDPKKEKKENPHKKIAESEIRLEKERLFTPLRRSRRGKSLLFDNNGDSCNFHNIGDVGELRGPYTKKQLIFSKMLQDEGNTVAKVPDSDDLHLDKHVENMPLRPREVDFSFPVKEKSQKRKKSTHKRKKLTKLNEMALANPISLNKVESTVLVPDKDEVCKIQYRVNNSECAKSDILALSSIKRIDLPIKSEKIAGKRKSSSSIINELVLSAKEKKLKTIIDEEDNAIGRNCDNNTKNVNTNDNAHIISAVRRCRSKSVVSQSTSEMYYSYENVSETIPNYKGQSEYKPTNQKIVNKTSNNDDVEFVNSTTTSILNTDIEGCCKEKQEQEEEATTWQIIETKALLSYPGESSIRDEPLKTPPETKKKNSRKNQEKSNNEPCETSSKTHMKTLSVTLEGHGTKNTEIQVDADKLDKEKHKESSGSSSKEFDYIVELLYKREKDDKRKHLIQEKEKQNKLKPLVDNQSLQNENTNQARTIFKTSSIIDAGEVHDHENVGNVEVDPYQMPDKEVDSTSERRPKITGKRKSISSNNNQPIFSSAIAKKIKTTMNDDNININNCYSSTKYAITSNENTTNTVLEKSVSDTNNYDYIKDKTAVTPAVLKSKSYDEDDSEKSNCHRKIVSYDEQVKPTEWNNTPSLSTSFSCMDDSTQKKQDDVAAGEPSESKFLFSDSDESSKSDEPLTKYIEEKEKKSQMKHPEHNKIGTDNRWVSVCVDKHDAKTTEFKSDNNDQLDKEKLEEINTSSNLDLDCLVKMTHNREKTDNGHNSLQKKGKQNISKPLFNELTYENEKESSSNLETPYSSNVTYGEDSDCDDAGLHQVCRAKDVNLALVENEPKLIEKRKSNSSNSSELVLSGETKKLKSNIDVDAYSENNIKIIENNTNSAVQRCRLKSVLTESTCEMYDPYDFNLLHKVTDEDPFLKRNSIKRLSYRSKLINTSNNNDDDDLNESNAPSTSILYKSTAENSQEPEKQGAATRQISEAQTILSDSDESSKSDEPLKKSAEKKKRKKTQSNHPENSNQKPCETSAETHKNKKTLSVSLEKQETKEANTEELSKENDNGSSTASTLEFDFLVELIYKREKKDKKHSSRINKEKKKKSNVDNPSLRNETTEEANNKVEYNENSDCDDIGLRQICSASDVDVPINVSDNPNLPTKNTKEVSTIDKISYTILDACKVEYNENSVCDNLGHRQTCNASDVDIKRTDNPSLRTISTKEASNKDKTSLTILDECKVVYNENSDCDNLGARQIYSSSDVDVPIKVVENTKSNTTLSKNELRQSFEGKSNINSEKIDGNNSDEIVRQSENSKNISSTISLKHGKKPVMRRCRSKSLLVKSTSGTYDPYDINLLDTDTDADPFSNRESLSNSAIPKKTSKSSIDRDTVVKTVDSSTPSSNISHSESNDLNKHEKQDSVNLQTAKELPCDSDESSKSDEPLTKYIEEKGKKKSEKNEEPHKALLKRKKKTLSVTSEKPDPDNGHDDNEERIRSEQFMESFGFFSERKPRKSNLLATKKISETYNLINSFREPEDKSNKKNVHSENRKTADDEGNLKKSFNTSNKTISKRGRKKKISTKIETSYCEACRKKFSRPDNFLRHLLSLEHVSRLSDVELKVKNVPTNEDINYLVIYKQQLDRLNVLQDKISRRKKYSKSLENIALPTLEDIIADVTRTVRQQQLAHRGLSRDEALFLDCCELLNASHNDDGPGRAKESSDCKIKCYTCVQTSADCLNLLEKRINDILEEKCDDGDVDSITAQDIMESEEVRNLENDLITGLKEAAASASNFKAKPITTCTPEEGVDTKQVNSNEHPKDVNIIKQSEEIKSKKAYEVKEKMYPDVIEDIDMFEDKFDKIKRKCRSQAAKQTKYVETSISSKSRKKVEKKKRKKRLKKNSTHGAVPTKGALKGFEGVKVSILTSDINMASILPPLSTPAKKKKRNNKRKKERKHSENLKNDSDHKSKDTQKKVDVYEFMDSEEAEPFEFRPSTLMERFKTIKDVKPSTSKSQPIDIDPEVSTESVSDGDDFVYMSDDYICSDAETENSLMSCELGNTKNSSEFKKSLSTPKRKDTTEKSAVMGKIFKHNAVRAEKKIAKTKEPIKPKANLDQLFDSLLEEPNSPITSSPKKEDLYNLESSFSHSSEISKRGSKSVKCHEDDGPDDSDSERSRKIERSPTPESFTSLTSQHKRRGSQNSSSKEKEFSTDKEDDNLASCSPSTSKDKNKLSFKHTSRKKKEALYENYDDKSFKYETKRVNTISPNNDDVESLFGVDESSADDNDSLTDDNRHKSKEKKFGMKSTDTDIENNSFDYTDEPINTYDDTGVARQRARRKCTVGKQNVLAETWSSESEPDGIPPRPNSADSVAAGTSRKKKNRKKDGHALGIRKSGNRQVSVKREAHCSNRSNRNSSESISRVVPTTRPSAVCSSSTKARTRPSPYYWSDEQEPEHVQQHGWIVGDSHKKLVTMLAHAKGKRNNDHKRNLVE
ncbi:unnamed protein product [Pieris macdunnoughi]|uniref:C2H2-type domain-containing protein n=1 Tax=Pieris macdunnoughi TaxID=345717 RepID=A0A821L8G5_9NEOP|nr:unnamed protein product [Pieris macdunnoughi]